MKLIYVYRKLGINVFFSQRTLCEGCYIYIFFGGGRGVQGDKTNPLVTQSLKILCVFNNK